MKLPRSSTLLSVLATLVLAGACSKDGGDGDGSGDGDGDGNSPGDGDGNSPGDGDGDGGELGDGDGNSPGDGDGDGDGNSPGDGDGDGGAGPGGDGDGGAGPGGDGDGEPEPVELCGLPFGQGDVLICAEVPEACGNPEDYLNDPFFTSNSDDTRFSTPSDSIVFLLDGDDEFRAFDTNVCVVGGEGDDTFTMGGEGSGSDIFVGGAGSDTFRFNYAYGELKVIADFEPSSDFLYFGDGRFNIPSGSEGDSAAQYVEILADFAGTSEELSSESTRIIYDPDSGYVWHDTDGNAGSTPRHFATILNFATVTITKDVFFSYPTD